MAYQLKYTHGPAMAVVEVTALAFSETAELVLREIASRTRERREVDLAVLPGADSVLSGSVAAVAERDEVGIGRGAHGLDASRYAPWGGCSSRSARSSR